MQWPIREDLVHSTDSSFHLKFRYHSWVINEEKTSCLHLCIICAINEECAFRSSYPRWGKLKIIWSKSNALQHLSINCDLMFFVASMPWITCTVPDDSRELMVLPILLYFFCNSILSSNEVGTTLSKSQDISLWLNIWQRSLENEKSPSPNRSRFGILSLNLQVMRSVATKSGQTIVNRWCKPGVIIWQRLASDLRPVNYFFRPFSTSTNSTVVNKLTLLSTFDNQLLEFKATVMQCLDTLKLLQL